MTEQELRKMHSVLQMIQNDFESDAAKLDGTPFDGKHVAPKFGEIYAMIKGVAATQQKIVEHLMNVKTCAN